MSIEIYKQHIETLIKHYEDLLKKEALSDFCNNEYQRLLKIKSNLM